MEALMDVFSSVNFSYVNILKVVLGALLGFFLDLLYLLKK